MAADGSIIIDTKIDDDGISKGFQRIKSDMGGIAAQARKMGNDIKISFSNADFSKPVAKAQAQIKSLERQMATTTEKFDIAKESGNDKAAERLDLKRMDLYDRLKTARDNLAIETAAAAQRQATAEEQAASREQAALGKTESRFKSLTKVVGNLGAKLRSVVLTGLKKVVGLFGNANKSTGQFSTRLRSIASGAFVFNLISRGLTQITKYFGSVLKANNAFSAALAKLKGALLTAFQPIYEVIVPALTSMVNILTRAAQAVGQFFAAITGKSYSAMAKNAEGLYETAQGLEAAGGAAKDAQKIFSGLDEVNVYSSKDSGGGGGSASAAPNFSISEQIEGLTGGALTSAAVDLTTKLNDMIANVDWRGLGDKVATGINSALGFVATAILNFDWFAAASNIGVMLNEVINNVDWGNLGVVLGAKFIVMVEGLGGLFSTIDWGGLGRALASAFMGLWNSIDWAQAAKTLSDGLKGTLKSLSSAIQTMDWQQIGNDVATFIATIDWNGLFVALSEGIGAALAGIAEFIWGLIEKAWNSVAEWWRENAIEDGEFTMKGLLEGILNGLKNIGAWIKENIFQPFINGFKSVFGIHSPSTVMQEQGNYIIQGLLQGITNTWRSIPSFFSNALSTLGSTISAGWTNIKNGALSAWTNIKNQLVSTWNTIRTSASNMWSNIVTVIKKPINAIIGAINGMISGVVSGINTVIRALNRLSFTIPSWLPVSFAGRSFGFNISTLTAPQIPYLAQGAVIPPNAPFMAVLGDQKSGTNIEAPLSTIREALGMELDKRSTTGRGNVYNVDLKVNGRTILQTVLDEAKMMQIHNGNNPFYLGAY